VRKAFFNSNVRFFIDIFRSTCRVFLIFLLLERTKLEQPSRYTEHAHLMCEKEFRGIENTNLRGDRYLLNVEK